MFGYEFANEEFLYLLSVLPLMIVFYIFRQNRQNASVTISSYSFFNELSVPFRLILLHILFAIKIAGLAFLIIALARPQSSDSWSETTTEGIDIALCMDISGSMRAMDFKPDRLEAAKDVASEFINGRPSDRFAVVAFSAESFTVSPLTSDRTVPVKQLNQLEFGMIEDGTAIGLGLATSVNRLKTSKAKSKIIILLTDGVNNSGTIGPVTAAEIALEYGIRVYTIGVGSRGTAPMPVQTVFGRTVQNVEVEIDEKVLKDIAKLTGGEYFRATDNQKLKEIYEQIDRMEKTIMETQDFTHKKEEYFLFLLIGTGLLLLDFIARQLFVRTIP